jgi:hypothetical protein
VVVRLCCALPFSLDKGDRSEWHFWITVYVDRATHILSHLFVIIYVLDDISLLNIKDQTDRSAHKKVGSNK